MLVGNKSDLKDQREVTVSEGTEAATKFGLSFLETSALAATNVEESFKTVLEEIYNVTIAKNVSGRIGEESRDPRGDPIKLEVPSASRKASKPSKCC